jgi:hypothetical protein
MSTNPLTEAELDARLREQRDAQHAAMDDMADYADAARSSAHPHWSDELDALERDGTRTLRHVAIGIVAVALLGAIVIATIGPRLWL